MEKKLYIFWQIICLFSSKWTFINLIVKISPNSSRILFIGWRLNTLYLNMICNSELPASPYFTSYFLPWISQCNSPPNLIRVNKEWWLIWLSFHFSRNHSLVRCVDTWVVSNKDDLLLILCCSLLNRYLEMRQILP